MEFRFRMGRFWHVFYNNRIFVIDVVRFINVARRNMFRIYAFCFIYKFIHCIALILINCLIFLSNFIHAFIPIILVQLYE